MTDSSMKQKKMNVIQHCKCCSPGPVSETFEIVMWFLCSKLLVFWIHNQCNGAVKMSGLLMGAFHFVGLQMKNSKDEIK